MRRWKPTPQQHLQLAGADRWLDKIRKSLRDEPRPAAPRSARACECRGEGTCDACRALLDPINAA